MKRVKKLSESGSIQGRGTKKSDLKLDSLRFLILITRLQSHSVICIRRSAKYPCRFPKSKESNF